LIALRQAHPALCASGAFEPVAAEAGGLPFVYKRQSGEESLLVAINPSGQPRELRPPGSLSAQFPETLYGEGDVFRSDGSEWILQMPGVSGGVYRIRE
jgi:hypothetical protein